MSRGAAALLALAAACGPGRDSPTAEPGTELYATSPGAVDEILFSSRERKMLAFRRTPGAPFELLFVNAGDAGVERCAAGDGFQRWLTAVSSLPIARRLDPPVDARASGWADLRLRDSTGMEPIDVRLRIPPADQDSVVVRVDAQQYVADVDATVLRSVVSGCRALGAASPAVR